MKNWKRIAALTMVLTLLLPAFAEEPVGEPAPAPVGEVAEVEEPKQEEPAQSETEDEGEEQTEEPTEAPTEEPTEEPTEAPTEAPTTEPTATPEPDATEEPVPVMARGFALSAFDYKVEICPNMTLSMLREILYQDVRPKDALTGEPFYADWKVVDEKKFAVEPGTYEFRGLPDMAGMTDEQRAQYTVEELSIRVHLVWPEDGLFYADGFSLKIEDEKKKTLSLTYYEGSEPDLTIPFAPEDEGSLPSFKLEGWTIESVGANAFEGNETLETIRFTAKVDEEEETVGALKSIAAEAFKDCTALTAVTIPDCAVVAEDAFEGCDELTSLGLVVTEDAWLSDILVRYGEKLNAIEVVYGILTLDAEYDEATLTIRDSDFGAIEDGGVSDITARAIALVLGDSSSNPTFDENGEYTIEYGKAMPSVQWVYKSSGGSQGYKGKVLVGLSTTTTTNKYIVGKNPYTVRVEDTNYTISFDKTYTLIVTRDIDDVEDRGIPVQSYNAGADVEPAAELYNESGALLKEGTDYTIEYKNNRDIGTATYTITGKGYYTGTTSGSFLIRNTVMPKDTNPVIMLYDGSTIVTGLSVNDFVGVPSGYEMDPVVLPSAEPGIYNVTVTMHPSGDTSPEKQLCAAIVVEVQQNDIIISSDKFDSNNEYTHEISSAVPDLKWYAVQGSIEGLTDYVIAADFTTIGKNPVTVSTTSTSYTIDTDEEYSIVVTQKLSTVNNPGIGDQPYTGSAVKPGIKLYDKNGKQLKEGTDYTITYSNNTAAGTASYTVTGKGYYPGTITGTFKIYSTSSTTTYSSSSTSSSDSSDTSSTTDETTTTTDSNLSATDNYDYTHGTTTANGQNMVFEVAGVTSGYLLFNRYEQPLPFVQEDLEEPIPEEELEAAAAAEAEKAAKETESTETAEDAETADDETPEAEPMTRKIMVIHAPLDTDETAIGDTYVLETDSDDTTTSTSGEGEMDTEGPNYDALNGTETNEEGELIDYSQPRMVLRMEVIRALRAADYVELRLIVGESEVRIPLNTLYAQFMDVDVVVDVKSYEVRLWTLDEDEVTAFDEATEYLYRNVLTPRHFEMFVNLKETDEKPSPEPIDILTLMQGVEVIYTVPEDMDEDFDPDAEGYLLVGVDVNIEEPLLSADEVAFDPLEGEEPTDEELAEGEEATDDENTETEDETTETDEPEDEIGDEDTTDTETADEETEGEETEYIPRTITLTIRKGGDYSIAVLNDYAVETIEYTEFGTDETSGAEV